jgi:hypothetical protein
MIIAIAISLSKSCLHLNRPAPSHRDAPPLAPISPEAGGHHSGFRFCALSSSGRGARSFIPVFRVRVSDNISAHAPRGLYSVFCVGGVFNFPRFPFFSPFAFFARNAMLWCFTFLSVCGAPHFCDFFFAAIAQSSIPSSTCPVLRPNSTIHALVRSVSYPRQCCGNEHCGEG